MGGCTRCRWPLSLALLLAVAQQAAAGPTCGNFSQPRFLPGLPGMHLAAGSEPEVQQVSVVLMNWKRAENIKMIVSALEQYPQVGEVLVLMCNSNTTFAVNQTKAQALDFTGLEATWGLTSRFKGCLLARHPWVLIMDDDLFLTQQGLQQLLAAKANNTERLISFYGRTYDASMEYTDPGQPGLHPIALTKVLLTDVRFCHAFFQLSYLMEDMARAHTVHWNGEDIFMSLVARKVTGQDHQILEPLPQYVQELSQGGEGISWTSSGGGHTHGTHRTTFMRTALDRLECVQLGGLHGTAPACAATRLHH